MAGSTGNFKVVFKSIVLILVKIVIYALKAFTY